MNALRAEWKKIMAMESREVRWQYIWDYYKFNILGAAFALFLIGSATNDLLINPPPRSVLTIAWMTGFEPEHRLDMLREVLYPVLVENPRRETVEILSFVMTDDPQIHMAQLARLSTLLAARQLDIVIGNLVEADEATGGDREDENIEMLGMVPLWAVDDLRSLEGNALFAELGFNTEGRYFGIISSTERYEAVHEAINVLWEES